jgi:hypothetical protein
MSGTSIHIKQLCYFEKDAPASNQKLWILGKPTILILFDGRFNPVKVTCLLKFTEQGYQPKKSQLVKAEDEKAMNVINGLRSLVDKVLPAVFTPHHHP